MIWKSSKNTKPKAQEESKNVVGAYHAKTHMGQMLNQIEEGEAFVITRNGRKVAMLLPYDKNESKIK